MKVKQYLIIRPTSPRYRTEMDPVVGETEVMTSSAGMMIVATRKTLKGAVNIRDKKYDGALVIPSY